jgi:NAD(P)-dependent dehydrogenase (short-subunit alcohol dehydrogenase family)
MSEEFYRGAKQTVVVTGGNRGVGYACAEALAQAGQNWCVIIAGHERERIASAAEKLRQASRARVEPMLLNLASLRSIHYFSENLSERLRDGQFPPLRALVCNAGVHPAAGITYTTDGYEQTFAVNHLGHFLLVNLLLAQFTPPGRIVVVGGDALNPWNFSGGVDYPPHLEARRLAWPESPGGWRRNRFQRYRNSKLCNVLFAAELSRRLAESLPVTRRLEIDVNVFDPSVTPGTGLTRSWPGPLRFLWQSKTLHSMARALGANLSTVEHTGRSLAGLILNPQLQGVSGKYFHVLNEREARLITCEPALAQKMWADSAELIRWQKPAEALLDLPAYARMEARAPVAG